jgi:hypothetical protein
MDLTFDTEALQTITFVRRYPVDNDIRKRQFVFEEAFHDTFPDPARVVNLPTNAPPEVPRFWFVHGKRSLQVNSITAQMNLDFTDGTPEDFDLFKIITRYAGVLDRGFSSIFADQKRAYSGIVVQINRRYSGPEEDIARFIAERMLKPSVEAIASALVNLSVRHGDFFSNIEISGYKQIAGTPTAAPGVGSSSPFLDTEFGEPSTQHGLSIKVDANSKPAKNNPESSGFKPLLPSLKEAFSSVLPTLMGNLLPKLIGG